MPENKLVIKASQIFANENSDSAYKVIDGNPRTKWVGGQFPGYLDIYFENVCNITKLVVETPKSGYSIFSVFASCDGLNYTQALSQSSEAKAKGYYQFDCNIKCTSLRFFIKYNSSSPYAEIRNIVLFGEESTQKAVKIEADYPCDFENSTYNVPLSDNDTVCELHALVARTVGREYSDAFEFELVSSDREFFELKQHGKKIKISANSGVNLAVGLNHYYKYLCNVHISQVGNNVKMPAVLPEVKETVHYETPFAVRYSYNYCALSYTMAFWNEEDWQKELDWLALQGANVILDITAQEEVWRRFLLALGYTMDEIKAFITGPAYYAWFSMANIYAVGGPLHDNFFKKKTELARKNHLFMRKMGMKPVLQGYSGMVPIDIKKHIPNAPVIPQGLWNSLARPYMLKTDTDTYVELARIFYDCQKKVFGDITEFFATDPFHEGGKSGRMKIERISKQIIESMLENNPDSIWIIQSWGENPSKKLLEGLEGYKSHALILDLYGEKRPRWENFLGREFMSTPWLYCMLNNFGGRMGLHGHLATIANEVARASKEASFIKGIGITPEATHSNPIVFDLFFETIWTKSENIEPIDLNEWFKGYIERRYGSYSENMYKALSLLNDTVYNPYLNEAGEGAPESVINARPAHSFKSASTWGNCIIAYDKKKFEEAVRYFIADYDKFISSEGYRFDLADMLKQILSNTAQEYLNNCEKAYKDKDLIEYMKWSDKFLEIILFTDKALSVEKEFLLGSWIEKAKSLADGLDDFSNQMFEFNARALITTWAGSRLAADDGGLKDYSNKQWSGLTADFYYKRWSIFIQSCINELSGKGSKETDWFRLENKWTWERKIYPSESAEISLLDISDEIFRSYTVSSANI